jgi:hypothetical protein
VLVSATFRKDVDTYCIDPRPPTVLRRFGKVIPPNRIGSTQLIPPAPSVAIMYPVEIGRFVAGLTANKLLKIKRFVSYDPLFNI